MRPTHPIAIRLADPCVNHDWAEQQIAAGIAEVQARWSEDERKRRIVSPNPEAEVTRLEYICRRNGVPM